MRRLVEAGVDIESSYLLNVVLCEVEVDGLQVRLHVLNAGALGDDRQTALGGPPEKDLGGRLSVLLGDLTDNIVLQEGLNLGGVLHVELPERGRAEGAVGGNGNALVLGKAEELVLDEVGVVLNLEGGWADLCVPEEVVDELGLEVGDADVLGEALGDEALHSGPRLLDGGLAGADLITLVLPARRVADGGVDVLGGDGEVDEVEIEVVDAPVSQLLLHDGLDALLVVEGVP